MATIAGRVFDNGTNNGIAGATIVASDRSPSSRRIRYIGATGNDGIYRIDNLPNSIFEIRATHPNYVANKIGSVIIDLTGTNDALGINIPLKPKKPSTPAPPIPTPTPTPTPPTPSPAPQGGFGEIKGTVIDSVTRKNLGDVQVVAFASPQGFQDQDITKGNGEYSLSVPEGRYRLQASKSGYKTALVLSPQVVANQSVQAGTIRLEPEKKPPGIKQGLPILTGNWWKENFWRIVRAYAITLFVYFVFYRPIIITGLGITPDPFPPWFFINFIVPFIGFPLVLFFMLPKNTTNLGDWGPFILAASVFAVTLGASYFPPFRFLGSSTTIKFGVPFILALITAYTANRDKEKGLGITLLHITSIMFLLGVLLFGINLITSGAFLNIETYLRPLDVLRVIGVPQDTIDNTKEGIRSVLSFLQFKGAESVKPEAKKIGGFEAIQLKFGSRYNDYLLPTLFARQDYVLPVTVINPNKFGTGLTVKDFTIREAFLNNGTGTNRIICGTTTKTDPTDSTKTILTGQINLDNINPEEEKSVTIDFKGKTTQNNSVHVTPAVGELVDCRSIIGKSNPLYTAKFTVDVLTTDQEDECVNLCQSKVTQSNTNYSVSNELDKEATKFKKSGEVCECVVKRYYNIMDDLCFINNDKTKIELSTTYNLTVQGKGELVLVKTDADRKSAPKPIITSSAGPLTVTTYFVSDVHVPGSSKTSIMFIQITNDGDGTAQINELKVNGGVFIGDKIDPEEDIRDDKLVIVKQCQPSSRRISITKDGITLSCPVTVDTDKTSYESKVTGAYLTVPVIVDINYTYSQTHSTTVNVKKEVIPDAVTNDDQIKDLNRQFKALPYYCPNKKVDDTGDTFDIEPLMIYNPK